MPSGWYTLLAILLIVALVIFIFWQRHQFDKRNARQKIPPKNFDVPTLDARIVGADLAWRSMTKRQQQIARLTARGLSNAEIANELGIKYGTVDAHLKKIYSNLQVRSRAELGYRIRDFID